MKQKCPVCVSDDIEQTTMGSLSFLYAGPVIEWFPNHQLERLPLDMTNTSTCHNCGYKDRTFRFELEHWASLQ